MLAVLFSLLLTLYLIIPEAIFRTIFGWYVPPRNFVISRAETAYRALVVAVLPLALAWTGSFYVTGMQTFPFPVKDNTTQLRRSDYKTVMTALYSEAEFHTGQKEFWQAFTRCSRRQARLIVWYTVLIGFEAWLAGWLAKNYGKFKGFGPYKWLADKFLFPYISEWHPLLTPYLFDEGTTVQADILCTNDTLYRGRVTQHFVKDGTLTGIFLTEPARYNRELYLKDRAEMEKEGKKPDKEAYWTKIPSQNLYFFANMIYNMNLNYKPPLGKAVDAGALRRLVIDLIGSAADAKITITQEMRPPNDVKKKGS